MVKNKSDIVNAGFFRALTMSLKGYAFQGIIAAILMGGSCGQGAPCEEYKNIACGEANSKECHEAMQRYPEMSPFECGEKIRVIQETRRKNRP